MTTTDWTTEAKGTGEHADVNEINLYYETHGSGKPLILLHGGLGSGEMFGPTLPMRTCSRPATRSRSSRCSTVASATAAGWAKADRPAATPSRSCPERPTTRSSRRRSGSRRARLPRRAHGIAGQRPTSRYAWRRGVNPGPYLPDLPDLPDVPDVPPETFRA